MAIFFHNFKITGGALTIEKMQTSMDVLTDARCTQLYASLFNTQAMICSGEVDVNKGACQVNFY